MQDYASDLSADFQMKRIRKGSPKFDLMRLLDQYARGINASIRDEGHHQGFMEELAGQLNRNKDNDILFHGLRVQAMFVYVAAALGNCKMLKEEDAGEIHSVDEVVNVPDFRLITRDDRELLVEVKNFHSKDHEAPFAMNAKSASGLARYSDLFCRELFIAIFWSVPKLWTLVPLRRIAISSGEVRLFIEDAVRWNHMHLLGDRMIGTLPNLGLRLFSDSTKPRRVGEGGETSFTIGRAELFCGETAIDDPAEQEIAWILLSYGEWPAKESAAEIQDGELISFGFVAKPRERSNPDQEFEIVGTLSTMISRLYNDITAPSGKIERLSTDAEPMRFDSLIPAEYAGSKLRLWRFTVQPAEIG